MKNVSEKTLIIILSETRSHQLTFDLFEKNFLNELKADLALCVADNTREDKHNPFYRHAKFIWQYAEPEDWGDAFDEAQKLLGTNRDWRMLLQVRNQWLGGIKGDNKQRGSAAILLFFRWFLKEKIIENDLISKYDRFIITRSDFRHEIPHIPLGILSAEYIWIPNGEDYGGYTDRHIVVPSKYIINVLSILEEILLKPDQLKEKMSFKGNWNLEKFIHFYFEKQNLLKLIRRFPYTFYTIRLPEGHTRWRKGKLNRKLGAYIKYESEYIRTLAAKKIIKKSEDWNTINLITLNILMYFVNTYLLLNKIKRILGKSLTKKLNHEQ